MDPAVFGPVFESEPFRTEGPFWTTEEMSSRNKRLRISDADGDGVRVRVRVDPVGLTGVSHLLLVFSRTRQ